MRHDIRQAASFHNLSPFGPLALVSYHAKLRNKISGYRPNANPDEDSSVIAGQGFFRALPFLLFLGFLLLQTAASVLRLVFWHALVEHYQAFKCTVSLSDHVVVKNSTILLH